MFNMIRKDDVEFIDDYFKNSRRNDADISLVGAGQFFKRQLEHVVAETYRANMPMPSALSLFPIDSSMDEGKTSFTHEMWEPIGEAVIISNYGHDLPRVNTVKTQDNRPIKDIGDAYAYTTKDIASARSVGENLDSMRAMAAREVIERKHNSLAWWGDAAAGIWGALNHPYIPRYAFSTALQPGSTVADVHSDLNAMINSPNALTLTTTGRDYTLALPPDEYAYVMTTPRSADSDTTIGDFLLKSNPWLKEIVQVWELDAAYNAGTALAFLFRRNSPGMKYVAPITFRQEPVERRNLEFIINCRASSGGFYAVRPLEVCVGELVRA